MRLTLEDDVDVMAGLGVLLVAVIGLLGFLLSNLEPMAPGMGRTIFEAPPTAGIDASSPRPALMHAQR
jgi:hypothetical protein